MKKIILSLTFLLLTYNNAVASDILPELSRGSGVNRPVMHLGSINSLPATLTKTQEATYLIFATLKGIAGIVGLSHEILRQNFFNYPHPENAQNEQEKIKLKVIRKGSIEYNIMQGVSVISLCCVLIKTSVDDFINYYRYRKNKARQDPKNAH